MPEFKDGDYTGEAGPSQMEAGEKKLKRKKKPQSRLEGTLSILD